MKFSKAGLAWIGALGFLVLGQFVMSYSLNLQEFYESHMWLAGTINLIAIFLILAGRFIQQRNEFRHCTRFYGNVADFQPSRHTGPFYSYYVPEALRRLFDDVKERLKTSEDVLIIGQPLAGKTRMALEAIRAVLPNYNVLEPNPNEIDRLSDKEIPHFFPLFCKPRVVLWLDDLEQYAKPKLEAFVRRFEIETASLLIVATCHLEEFFRVEDAGEDLGQIRDYRLGKPFMIPPLQDGDILEFVSNVESEQPLKIEEHDGTIGSVVHEISLVLRRFNLLDNTSRSIMRVLLLCLNAGILEVEERFLRKCCEEILGVKLDEWKLRKALSKLDQSGFTERENGVKASHNIYLSDRFQKIKRSELRDELTKLVSLLAEEQLSEKLIHLASSFEYGFQDYETAEIILKRATKIAPGVPQGHIGCAGLRLRRAKFEKMLDPDRPRRVERHIVEAEKELNEGLTLIEGVYDRVKLELEFGDILLLHLEQAERAGEFYQRANNDLELASVRLTGRGVPTEPTEGLLWRTLQKWSRALILQREFAQARDLLNQLYSHAPEDIDVVTSLIVVEIATGNWPIVDPLVDSLFGAQTPQGSEHERALELFVYLDHLGLAQAKPKILELLKKQLIRSIPDTELPDFLEQLCVNIWATGRLGLCLTVAEWFCARAQTDDHRAEALQIIANCYRDMEQPQEANKYYEMLQQFCHEKELKGVWCAAAIAGRADCALAANNLEQARKLYMEANEVPHGTEDTGLIVWTSIGLGDVFNRSGALTEAEACYLKAARYSWEHSGHSFLTVGLGEVYEKKEKWHEAEIWYALGLNTCLLPHLRKKLATGLTRVRQKLA